MLSVVLFTLFATLDLETLIISDFIKFQKNLMPAAIENMCIGLESSNLTNNCTKEEFCSVFSKNFNKTYIYINSDGDGIPNYPLYQAERKLLSCINDPTRSSMFNNPFLDINFALDKSDNQFLKNRMKYETKVKKVEEIFNQTKIDIINILNAREKNQKNTRKKYDALIKRINTLRIVYPSKENGYLENYCSMPNASYDYEKHFLVLCPQCMEFPEATIRELIAHEMAHSIDPCHMAKPLIKQNLKVSYDEMGDTTGQFSDDSVHLDLGYSNEYSDSYFVDLEDKYIKNKSIASEQIALEDNPTYSVVECLMSNESANAKTPSKEELLKILNENKDDMGHEYFMSLKDKLDLSFDDLRACNTFSQIQESWSDWMAAEVIGERLKKIPPEDKMKYAFESVAFLLYDICPNQSDIRKSIEDLMKEHNCSPLPIFGETNLDEDSLTLVEAYPSHTTRLNRIFLSNPSIKAALGCTNSKLVGKYCK